MLDKRGGTVWLVFERRFTGEYSPALYHGPKPTRKKVEGKADWEREPIDATLAYRMHGPDPSAVADALGVG